MKNIAEIPKVADHQGLRCRQLVLRAMREPSLGRQ